MRDLGILILRVVPSLLLIIFHGIPKIYKPHYALVKQMGLPFPEVFTWASILAETLFALFVIIGLFTRISSVIIIINFLFVLYFHFFIEHYPIKQAELAILFLIVYIAIALLGPGRYSVDRR
ncbi:MAG: DoxX family protein [candidate division WOR-3 bacterium]|jgi:putative oxidoreductase